MHSFEDYAEGYYNSREERDACGVGFAVNKNGIASNFVLQQARTMLIRMHHRGANDPDQKSGDGSGVMTSIPDEFFRANFEGGRNLPPKGQYAVAMIFVDRQESDGINKVIDLIEKQAKSQQLKISLWKEATVDNSVIGDISRMREPFCLQVFLVSDAAVFEPKKFSLQVFIVRKQLTHILHRGEQPMAYICSLSVSTIVYKGMFQADQLWDYFLDLKSDQFKTHFAIVHNRFSTNTLPAWSRAHPQRILAHNGEINTLMGNVNYSNVRRGQMEHPEISQDLLRSMFPVIESGTSDSGSFDNVLEWHSFLSDRSLPEILISMIPEAWQNDALMDAERKAFYQFTASFFEPWDGPANIVFSDGRYVGAILDRNGLRPSRFYVTSDGMVYLSSEVGVLDLPEGVQVEKKGRLESGRLVIVDTQENALLDDEELKKKICKNQPYKQWLEKSVSMNQMRKMIPIDPVPDVSEHDRLSADPRVQLFGFSQETINLLLVPMLTNNKEALGSMGNDAPLACVSKFNPLVFDYFKQLFAQVTNPPIDPFREKFVMSLKYPIGPEANSLVLSEKLGHRLWLDQPILSQNDLEIFKKFCDPNFQRPSRDLPESDVFAWRGKILDATKPEEETLKETLLRLQHEAEQAVAHNQADFLILSDRNISTKRVPIPSLLILGSIHQHLLKKEIRMKCALIVESGEAKEVHHMCTLMGFGADAICPYMVFETVKLLRKEGVISKELCTDDQFFQNYVVAIEIGLRKVMAKMGISTLQSYRGAQIFEALGLNEEVVDMCFTSTATRVGGANFEILEQEALARHRIAFDKSNAIFAHNPGQYHWRAGGEKHMNEPNTIAHLQNSTKNNSVAAFEKFVDSANRSSQECTLRGQFEFAFPERGIPLEEVQSSADIVKLFATGAMSLGSISNEAHTTLAIVMNEIGARSNTGEGGELPERYLNPKHRSSIKQVASARFGVNSSYLAHADMLQIKIAQGAKPGEGGELPGYKVSEEIARIRHSIPGVGLISPPPHHDIYSIEDLAQLIYDLKCANPQAYVSVKLVSEVGVGVIASGVAKAQAAHITISGHDGGTGASSWTGIKHAGLPWELGLSETHQTLVHGNLRRHVVLQADGQIRTGRDVVIAAILGADEFGMSTTPLIVLGCTMMRKCHLNTCPVGVATQDPVLRAKFAGKPEHLINYFFLLADDVRKLLAKLGVSSLKELIGRTDLLKVKQEASQKSRLLNFAKILTSPKARVADPCDHVARTDRVMVPLSSGLYGGAKMPGFCLKLAENLPEHRRLDRLVLQASAQVIEDGKQICQIDSEIANSDRCFGATVSYAISKIFQEAGLPDGKTIQVNLKGQAGQSFCAFLAKGISVTLIGDANDSVCKGLSGGFVVIKPAESECIKSQENIILGNVCLYGAISGKLYIRGQAAERFCVRNSGATVVVEGVGHNGCEYMTGGRAIILGPTGKNFAAGMSGGLAFVYDPQNTFERYLNKDCVNLYNMNAQNEFSHWLRQEIDEFLIQTGSEVAQKILTDWDSHLIKFKLVFPKEYQAALEKLTAKEAPVKAIAQLAKTRDTAADIEDYGIVDAQEKLEKITGFMKYKQMPRIYKETETRMKTWNEIHDHKFVQTHIRKQAARCMDCGVPFCQSESFGCPLGNLIPNWNDLVYKNEWEKAHLALAQTNNFPEFTGRVCPAPCQAACVLGINEKPVMIKHVECAIADTAWEKGWNQPIVPVHRTGKKIAVIGSGPSGLACAAQLNRAGHSVTVLERRNLPGGLLRYGIPTMKLERSVLNRRLDQMKAEGVVFRCNVQIGSGNQDPNRHIRPSEDNLALEIIDPKDLLDQFDAISFCVGATWPRDIPIPNRDLSGIHFAMSFLERWQRVQEKSDPDAYSDSEMTKLVKDKRVVVLGGGDTGVDCIATSLRLGAKSIETLEILPQPPETRDSTNPWPEWPRVWRIDYGHEEVALHYGRDPRKFSVQTKRFIGNDANQVCGIEIIEVRWFQENGVWRMEDVPGTEKIIDCDLVLLAMGFLGPEKTILESLGLTADARSNIKTDPGNYRTNISSVYAAGDCRRGQSLVVHAINEGRQCARVIDLDLMGSTNLPGPGGIVDPGS